MTTTSARVARLGKFTRPGRAIAIAFASAIAVGTALLSLPFAAADGARANFDDALFTATSAVCVTGLVTVDTGTYWSGFGQAVILLLIQVGGLGIMTSAGLVALLLSHRLGMRAQMVMRAETKSLSAADVRRVIRNIVLFSLGFEAVVAIVLTARIYLAHREGFWEALYSGTFHAISAFNNAGFSLHADSLTRYATDPWINAAVIAAVMAGGLGFPVVFELCRSWRRPGTWSVLTRITVVVTVSLLALGTLVILATEWNNPRTLGQFAGGDRILAAFFASVTPRTAGFNTLDVGSMRSETLFFTDALMFIGGGSAGTAGGIKVTTFGLLAYVLWAELRSDPDVEVGIRRIPAHNQRQALAVALLSIATVAGATFAMMSLTDFSSDAVLFETVSAFGTVGLSTGITGDLPLATRILVIALMFVGRIGPLTLASGLALRERARRRSLPEERTIVG